MRASTLVRILAGAALAAYVTTGALSPLANNDVWIHLTTGRLILEEGEVPRADRYSFTAEGSRYVAHEWLAACVYALGERLGGVTGVIVAGKLLPSLALLAALGVALRAAGASAGVGFPLALLAMTLARHRMIARPELFALVLATSMLAILLRDRRALRAGDSRRGLFWLVPLEALWANLHGSFPLGVVLVLLFALAEAADRLLRAGDRAAARWRAAGTAGVLLAAAAVATLEPPAFARPAALTLAALAALVAADGAGRIFAAPPPARAASLLPLLGVAAAMTLAVLANPRGAEIYLFPFEFTAGVNPVTANIEEWKPLLAAPLLYDSLPFAVYLMLLALIGAALAAAAWRGRAGRLELILLAAFGVLPLRHARWMSMFTLVALPPLAATLEALRAAPVPGSRAVRAVVCLGLAAGAASAAGGALHALAVGEPDAALRIAAAAAAACGALALAAGGGFAPGGLRRHVRFLSVSIAGALAAGLAGLAVAHGIPELPGFPRRPQLGVRAAEPIRPVALLRRLGLEGRLFTEYDWAGYAIHQLWPGVRVFIDSRSEVYGPELLLRFRDAKLSQPAARRAFTQFGVDLLLARYAPYPGTVFTNPGVLGVAESDPAWRLVYVDDGALLYARHAPGRALPPGFERLRPRRLRPGDPGNAEPALEAEVRRAIELAPGSAFLHFALALCLRAQGRAGEARAEAERAFALNPRYPGAPQLAGELAAAAGDTEAARMWFRHAQAAYPGWPAPAQALARLAR